MESGSSDGTQVDVITKDTRTEHKNVGNPKREFDEVTQAI